jgi:hypothetical protein
MTLWRQEKDADSSVTKILEYDEETGREVETGYKHAYDNPHESGPLWIAGMCMLPFLLLIEVIRDLWRYRVEK